MPFLLLVIKMINNYTQTKNVNPFLIYFQAYITAVNSGVENIQEVLLSPEAQRQLIPSGPRLVHYSTKARKIVDTEDTDLKYSAQPDGTLVTEKRQTTEHEEFNDNELPEEEDDHSVGDRERVETKVSWNISRKCANKQKKNRKNKKKSKIFDCSF